MALGFALEVGGVERRGKRHAAVVFQLLEQLIRRDAPIGATAVVLEHELIAMLAHGGHHPVGVGLAILERRGGNDRADHNAGKEVPGLGVQPYLHADTVLAGLAEKVIQLVEGFHRERTGRLQKDLEQAWAVAPHEWIAMPLVSHCQHSFLPDTNGNPPVEAAEIYLSI